MASDRREKNLKQLGEKLRKVREHSGLTQAEVAEKADIHVNYYARIERGEENPSFEKLQNIMKALGIKSLELL
ncbi:MAG: helix-turn-helix transcriptional regulator [Patescibacteria group bacterium]